ncbi:MULTISPECIES: ATP-binding protein [unclassified Streptomyces]|uniref:AAA family ATPase n=1 Tax=unclassified Streptomyces TaxID=2593676 RepID=UPI0006F64875|nr:MULTISPECIES: ATP-binding protein [unclassified Streptomyces]KQX54733.1 kinase [Streptomyces sp. Root1304]KRA93594.1 kinase [Streptomyces sp. Root66D1]
MTTLFLMVGLPGAGKTTRARQLAEEHGALRLTPDDWMLPLFGETEADGKRDVLEGRMLWLALEAVRLGTSVVVDYGCWSREERSAIRWLAEAEGARFRMVYLPVDEETQRARIAHRRATTPEGTLPITEADIQYGRAHFEAPDASELEGQPEVAGAPSGWAGWREWAAGRWPSFA